MTLAGKKNHYNVKFLKGYGCDTIHKKNNQESKALKTGKKLIEFKFTIP